MCESVYVCVRALNTCVHICKFSGEAYLSTRAQFPLFVPLVNSPSCLFSVRGRIRQGLSSFPTVH